LDVARCYTFAWVLKLSAVFIMDSDVPSPSTSFDAYQPKLQSTVLNTAKVANGLPPAADMGFQRTIDRKFAKDIDSSSVKVLNLANRLLSLVQGGDSRSNDPNGKTKANGRSSEKGKQKALLTDEDDVLDGYHTLVVDIVDQLLESAVCLLSRVTQHCRLD
jgi:exosome complex exonuclease RRP6